MKKIKLLLYLVLIASSLTSTKLSAQPGGQFTIGNQGNQTATNVKVLPDGTGTIIAGYEYDISPAGDLTNAMMVLMKVNPSGNTIIWQERFGIPGTNNLVQNMIITHNGDIVIVGTIGRNSVYDRNTAAIMRFSSVTGGLIWQRSLHDQVKTVGGEIFYGVTELGAASNYDLVAVGSHDSRPMYQSAMVCVYHSNGTFVYGETWDLPNSDCYYGVCTAANGRDVYMCGTYINNYADVRIDHYRPYATATSGSMIWKKQFDFSLPGITLRNGVQPGTLNLNNNFSVNIYLSGTKLLVHGGSLNNYTFTGGEGESIMRMNADGTGTPELWQIQNSGLNYANTSKIAVVDADHVFNVQMPASSAIDPIIWLTGTNADAVITEVTSLTGTGPGINTHSTIKTPMKFTTPSGGIHSLFDLDLTSSNAGLVSAGSTNDSLNFGNNDIYFVMSPTTAPGVATSIPKHDCDEENTGGCLQVAIHARNADYDSLPFTPEFVDVFPESIQYDIQPLCKQDVKCYDSANLTMTSYTDIDGNCVFTVTAHAYTSGTIKGYEWTLPGGVSQVFTSASSDTKVITLGPGAIFTVDVRVLIVSDYWEEGGSPCCEARLSEQLMCRQGGGNPCDTMAPPVITATSMIDADGNCVPVYFSSVYPVTIGFSATAASASPYWGCGPFSGSQTLLGGTTPDYISPCSIYPSGPGGWNASSCWPAPASIPYPCPLSSPATVRINYMIATTVTYGNCTWNISVPIDPNCPPPLPGMRKKESSESQKTTTQLNVVPNPTDGIFTLSGTLGDATASEVMIEITDMLGKVILADKCAVNHGKISKNISLDNVPNGVYIIKLIGNNEPTSLRFVVER